MKIENNHVLLPKILLIDDDVDILEALQLVLDAEGYVTATTSDSEQVQTEIERFQPNLIILDMLLSGNDGREICKMLKKADLTKQIPIIMISAHPEAEKTTLAAGADGFIAKPFDIDELLQRVSEFVK